MLLCAVSVAQAQPSSELSVDDLPTQQQLQERIDAIANSTGIDQGLQEQLLELYQEALERLMAAQKHADTAAELEQLVRTAPKQLQDLQQQIQALPLPQSAMDKPPIGTTLGDIQQILAQEKAALAGLQNQIVELERQLRQAQSRPSKAREELATAKQRRQDLEQELEAQAPDSENERLTQARRVVLQARELALRHRIRALDQELLSNDARQALLKARLNLAQHQLELQTDKVRQLDESANQYSLTDAAELAKQAARAAIGAEPIVQDAAGRNAALSDQLARLVKQLEDASANQQRLQSQLDQLQARFRTSEQQLEIAGLSQTLGDILRRERRSLPAVSQTSKQINERQQTISEMRLRQFQLEQELQSSSIDEELSRLLADQPPQSEETQQGLLEERLHQLLTDRADLWKKLAINYNRYADQLLEVNRLEQQLVDQTLAYQNLLDENLFWIANVHPASKQWLNNITLSFIWLLEPGKWTDLVSLFKNQLIKLPLLAFMALLLAMALIAMRPRLLHQLTRTSARVGTDRDRILITVLGLCLTLLLALPGPVVIGMSGLILADAAPPASFSAGVGEGLLNTAIIILFISGFRQLCRERGVAQVHFRWRHISRQALRRELSWLLAVSVPVGFLITLTETQADELYRDGLGRLAFVVGSVALAIFSWRLLRPRFRLSTSGNRARRRGWWHIRRPLRMITTLLPLGLAGLALYGYHYTALQLESRLISSGWLLVGLIITGNLFLRWIRLVQQRLDTTSTTALPTATAGAQLDTGLASADEQARTLLTVAITAAAAVGLWLIWSDLLPALNILRSVVLWESATPTGVPLVQVTVGDLALATVVTALTLIAARNLPSVLEVTVLHRLAIDPGNRYAFSSIARYFIIAIGLIVAISLAGVRWNQVQWLVAALGVGLGFGLQEIFANFISGLILLFERPIRVGDTITVNEMTGRVSRIQIRATTITDWDRRELIIPNKTFITDRLINWTLTDQVTRIVLRLRIPFNSSPDAIRQILLECANEHPLVLREPAPFAYVVGTDESALEFKLYVFTAEISDRLPVRHELYTDAVRRLTEHGVDIPYPQHDLHIRSLPSKGHPETGL